MYVNDDQEWSEIRIRRSIRISNLISRLNLISFKEMADACARKPGGVERDEALRQQAYRDLEQSVLRGEFGPTEKPVVAYLQEIPHGDHPGRFPLRLTAGQLIRFREFNIVADLWAPHHLCVRWFKENRIPVPPWLAEPPSGARWRSPQRSETVDTSRPNARMQIGVPKNLIPIRNTPGKVSVKMDAAVDAMVQAVDCGEITLQQLVMMKQKSLEGLYSGAKRTLLAEARRRALSHIEQRSVKKTAT
jgi:hypothetical protein